MVLIVKQIEGEEKEFEQEIPELLIRDIIDGQVFCYKSWQEVLNKTKTPEDIMGCSGVQSLILQIIEEFFYANIGTKNYWFFGNEAGNHIDTNNNVSFDKVIYERSKLSVEQINEKYIKIAPKLVIEVDVKVDTSSISEADYVHKKIQKLLDYGTERVIWIFYESEKIIIAEQGKDWITTNWSSDFEILDGHYLNLKRAWQEQGF